jgi:two-component system nitrate/nitrite response regulator NarL
MSEVANTAASKLAVSEHISVRSETKTLEKLSSDADTMSDAIDTLQDAVNAAKALPTESEKAVAFHDNVLPVMDALRAGASGYLLKNIETDTLIEAIRKAAQGESVVSQQMTAKLIQGVRNPPKQEAAAVERDRFSPRERDILAALAQGESNKEIARKLDLAESTVKIHVQNIFKKLNMSSRVQVALYAVENGYGR